MPAVGGQNVGALALNPGQSEAVDSDGRLPCHDLGDRLGSERHTLKDLAHDVLILGGLVAVTRRTAVLPAYRLGRSVVSSDEGLARLRVAVAAGVPDKPATTR